jgi:hypothetical protein
MGCCKDHLFHCIQRSEPARKWRSTHLSFDSRLRRLEWMSVNALNERSTEQDVAAMREMTGDDLGVSNQPLHTFARISVQFRDCASEAVANERPGRLREGHAPIPHAGALEEGIHPEILELCAEKR